MSPTGPAAAIPAFLRGMFGYFQQASAAGESTQSVWESMRSRAAEYSQQIRGLPPLESYAEMQDLGASILSQQGIGIFDVNAVRGAAGEWRGARQAIAELGPDQQITAGAIFRAPWSTSGEGGSPERYRIRTQWQFEPEIGDAVSKWTTTELSTPLTSIEDAIAQAEPDSGARGPQGGILGSGEPTLLDFEIEQV